jgi:predicted alpha/beta superfamily hydrolase
MKIAPILFLLALLTASNSFAAGEDAFYKLGPDSLPQEGVPHGKLLGPMHLPSQVFPNYTHTYWIYVPAQYDPKQPAGLLVFQDGSAMIATNGDVRVPTVLDNLIWRREIPVIITVFISPAITTNQPEPSPSSWGDRDSLRPQEYNEVTNRYARVICEEFMPVITNQFNISPAPDLHCIAGSSSGAIAAFGVAWFRPDQFHKVISSVGSFVNLRGGYVYPEMVLASERKPIRMFFCDGVNDLRGTGRTNAPYDVKRDWHIQNIRLVDAMTKKGYDVNYTWGIGLHGQKQFGAQLPEIMRWIWRDYPRSADPDNKEERSFHAATSP